MAREKIKRKNPTRSKVSKLQCVADEAVVVKISVERQKELRCFTREVS